MTHFPIKGDGTLHSIPLTLIEAHAKTLALNHRGRTVEQQIELGGLYPEEAIAVIEDRPWERMGFTDARQQLTKLVQEYEGVQTATAGHAPRSIEGLERSVALVKSLSRQGRMSALTADEILDSIRAAQVSLRALAARVGK